MKWKLCSEEKAFGSSFIQLLHTHAASREDKVATQKSDLAVAYLTTSTDCSCKPSVMRLRNPRDVRKKLYNTCQSVATASIDAKLLKLQNIEMSNKESIVKYATRLKSPINELLEVGHSISENEKLRSFLRGLRQDFAVAAKSDSNVGENDHRGSFSTSYWGKFLR